MHQRRITTLVRRGHPAEEIVLSTVEYGSDLIVVGSHGQSGLKRFLLGSVSDQVLRHAPRSVLVAKQLEPRQAATGNR